MTPLVRRVSSRGLLRVRKLEFSTIHADYNDAVLGGDFAAQIMAVVDCLAQTADQWDIVDLRDLGDSEDRIACIRNSLAHAGLSYRFLPERERCPYMSVQCSWAEMIKKHSRSTRRVFRNFTEMTREGLRVRIVEDPQKEPGLLKQLIALEAQKRVRGERSAPFLGIYSELFQSLFDTLGPRGWITVVLLEWKGRLVAWQLLYRCGKKLWGYSTAYDHGFSDLSPGTVLIPAVVDYCYAHGFEEFDLLRGEEPYKMRWATGFHQSYRLLIWNRRWMSRLRANAYLRFRVQNSISKMVERQIK